MSADAPDAVALQEVPIWALARLGAWSGMQALGDDHARPARPARPSRHRPDPGALPLDPAGQANALLVNPHFELGRHRRLVINPGVSRKDWLLRGGQRRVCHTLEVDARGVRLVLANLHASNDPDHVLVKREINRAASLLVDEEHCLLLGDFNVERYEVPGFTAPIEGSIRSSCADSRSSMARSRGSKSARRVDGRVLFRPCARGGGDRIDLVAVRRGLPVLERYAYLNTGTFGPLPRATVEAMQAVERRELEEGRSSHAYFEQVMEQRELLARRARGPPVDAAEQVALTSSTTEGCNIILGGLRIQPGDEVVTTDSEHPGLMGGLVASGAELGSRSSRSAGRRRARGRSRRRSRRRRG